MHPFISHEEAGYIIPREAAVTEPEKLEKQSENTETIPSLNGCVTSTILPIKFINVWKTVKILLKMW